MNMRMILSFLILILALPGTAGAQATDPAAVGLILAQRGTNEGYVDRAHARKNGKKAKKAVSDECMRAWQRHDRMSREQRNRLYDLCPR